MTNVSAVTKHFPSAEEGFTTTLSSTISAGATTVGLNSLSGYTTGEVATFVVAPTVSSEKQVFTGLVDTAGLQLTNVVWTTGTNQTHAAGTTVVDYVTATHMSQVSKGILEEHNQDGSHGAITATSVASSGAVSGTTGTFTSDITEKGATLATMRDELGYDYVASGGVWTGDAYGSTLNASMTALVCYINGQRGTISAVTARAFAASSDTYVDILNDNGTFSLVYTVVANGAASPSLAANSLRLTVIVAGATNIASASSINQGRTPNNRNPFGKNFLVTATGSINSSGTTAEVDGSAPSITFTAADLPAAGRIYVRAYAQAMYMAGAGASTIRPRLSDNSAITQHNDGHTNANLVIYGQVITSGWHDVPGNTNVTIKVRGVASNTNAWQTGGIQLYCEYVRT